MAQVIPFPSRAECEPEIDLLTAVDVAIRDLRDIAARLTEESARKQANACRKMLEKALSEALLEC